MKRVLFLLALVSGLGTSAFALNTAASAPAAGKYPLTTCVVSGDSLDDPVHYVYKQPGKPDRVVEFCCKDCIADFQKDPAKYLAKLDAATAAQRTVSAKGGSADACPAGGSAASCPAGRMAAAAMPADCPMHAGSGAGACSNPESCPMMHGAKAAAKDAAPARVIPASETAAAPQAQLLTQYIPIADALAADNLVAAKTAAAALAKQATADPEIARTAAAVADATSLDSARSAFKTLSIKMEPAAGTAKGYVVMYCPMARADWIQTDTNVRNPYLGRMMSTCGAPKQPKMTM